MATIQILLATYNGARHLQTQLDSLLAQTNRDWELLVRDDGSTDETPAILEKFAALHPGRVRILRDDPEKRIPNSNLGPSENFSRLLQYSEAPFVMICDQDDRWHPDKIALTWQKMQEMEKEYGNQKPLLVHTDIAICDDQLNIRRPSYNRHFGVHKEDAALGRLLKRNNVTGMTMMLNRPMVEKVGKVPLRPPIIYDWWVGLVAALTGETGYVDKPLVDYRVHDRNVTAHRDQRSLGQKITDKLRWDEKRRYHRNRLENSAAVAQELLRRFGNEAGEKSDMLREWAELPSLGFMGRASVMLGAGSRTADFKRALLGGPIPEEAPVLGPIIGAAASPSPNDRGR